MITCLVEAGLRVDEDMVMDGYKAAVEVEMEDPQGRRLFGRCAEERKWLKY